MVDLSSFSEHLGTKGLPPIDQWDPDFCGDMDLRITRNGTWVYQNSQIKKERLVKLLSSVLRLETDGEYYLVTPVEKLRICVDDVPFVGVELQVEGQGREQRLVLRTNVDDIILVDADHPIRVLEDVISSEPSPYLMVRNGLEALISRPVFYELVECGWRLEPAHDFVARGPSVVGATKRPYVWYAAAVEEVVAGSE